MNTYSKILDSIKKDPDFIDLTNTNFTTLKPQLVEKDLKGEISKYFNKRHYDPHPMGLYSARAAISDYYHDQRGITIPSDHILITASTSESYSLIFSSLLNTGDTILLPRPAYPLFEYLAKYARLKFEFYDLKVMGNRWEIDIQGIELHAEKSKAIVLISPNNPTGMVLDQRSLNAIIKIVKDTKQILIIDEVFSSYIYAGVNPRIPQDIAPVLLLNGISKMLSAPDLKLAWIAITGKIEHTILDKLETCNDSYLNCSYLSQSLLPKLMEIGRKMRPKWLGVLRKNRKLLAMLLQKNLNITGIISEGGIHGVLNFPSLTCNNEEIAIKLLKEYKLAIHPGYFYEIDINEPAVIISLLNDNEIFALGISRLQDFSIKYS